MLSEEEFTASILDNKYIPQDPTIKQARFLLRTEKEGLFGGQAGGGKSSTILMAAFQYVSEHNYSALILRRTYADLSLPGAIMDRAREWLQNTDAKWNEQTKTWKFPSGATLTFGYLEHENDKYRYQGAEFQFCVEKGTKVLMGDSTYKKIENIAIGDEVQTLQGPKKVKFTWGPRIKECVKSTVYDFNKKVIGEQVHPIDHQILTFFGWQSFSSICNLYGISESIQYRFAHIPFLQLAQKSRPSSQNPLFSPAWKQQNEQDLLFLDHSGYEGYGVYSKDNHSYYKGSEGKPLMHQPLLSLCVPVVLHSPYPPLSFEDHVYYANFGEKCGNVSLNYQSNCLIYSRLYDGQFPALKDIYLNDLPLQADVVKRNRICCIQGGRGNIPKRNHKRLISYAHPYTKDIQNSSEAVQFGSCVLTPVGKKIVYDITVEDVNHYITLAHLVNKNCAFDELTQFTESQYSYLFSRLRRLENSDIPLRIRAASNPGGVGHEWVKARFITLSKAEMEANDRFFIPASLTDNPFIDQAAYEESLQALDPITKAQLKDGDWDVVANGNMFKREWFKFVEQVPHGIINWVRYWDMAASEPSPGYSDPDYTAGVLMGELNGLFYVADMVLVRLNPAQRDEVVKATITMDGPSVLQRMEQEGGASGKDDVFNFAKTLFKGTGFQGIKSSGSKEIRARGFSGAVSNGLVFLVRAPWNSMYINFLCPFPQKGIHDDAVDASSGAYNEIIKLPMGQAYETSYIGTSFSTGSMRV